MTCAGKILRVRNRGLSLPKEGRDKMSPFLSLFLFQRRENLEKYEDFIVVLASVSQKLPHCGILVEFVQKLNKGLFVEISIFLRKI